MTAFITFFNKEILEQIRTKKGLIFLGVAIVFGIMNPLMAKLTPEIMNMLSESMAESGISINLTVNAFTSWQQFYKNMPMLLIVFVLLYAATFTNEYQKGTLINVFTKGISRSSVLLAKTMMMLLVWTAGIIICFGLTYGYTAYYWDNSIISNCLLAAVYYWIFGLLFIGIMVIISSFASSSSAVLLGCGGIAMIMLLIDSFGGKIAKYLPSRLSQGLSLLNGNLDVSDFTLAVIVTGITVIVFIICSIQLFNKHAI